MQSRKYCSILEIICAIRQILFYFGGHMRSPTNIVLFQGSHAQSHKYCSVSGVTCAVPQILFCWAWQCATYSRSSSLYPGKGALQKTHKNVFKRVGVGCPGGGQGVSPGPLLDFNILQFLSIFI